MGWDLGINLLAAIIAFSAGVASRALFRYLSSTRPASKVWRPPRHISWSVVVADGPLNAYGQPTVHPAEFAAATEIMSFLGRTFRAGTPHVSIANGYPLDAALERSLVVIGGPIHNAVHRIMIERMKVPYEFRDRVLVRTTDDVSFTPQESGGGVPAVDYGLIVIGPNPFNPRARVVLLAGCRTFGCLGAARSLVEPFVRHIAPLVRDEETNCFVVKMDVLGSYVGRLEIVS